jgi:uncharacterized protein YggE
MHAVFDVTATAQAVDECTRRQQQKTQELTGVLRKALGPEAQVSVGSFTIMPYTMARMAANPPPAPAEREWKFYETINVFAPSIPAIGKAIDSAMAAGADRVITSGFRTVPSESSAGASVFNPDIAGHGVTTSTKPFVQLQITATAPTATECATHGSAIGARVVHAIESALGTKAEVKVLSFQVNQTSKRSGFQGLTRVQPAPLSGYRANSTVSVDSKNLNLLGAMVAASASTTAGELSVVQFTLSNDSPAVAEAIQKATNDAKAKAAATAKAMGVQLGRLYSVATITDAQPETMYGGGFREPILVNATGSAVAARAGEVGFNAKINVIYQIKE